MRGLLRIKRTIVTMGTIEYRTLNDVILSVEQANKVCRDLDHLDTHGIWAAPDWAAEVGRAYEVGAAHIRVQLAAWRAAARAYRSRTIHVN